MNAKTSHSHHILKLNKGDQLVASLVNYCRNHHIRGGFFYGLGAVANAEIGFYNLDKREYQFQTFDRPMELTNITGNVAVAENEIIIHAHVTLADDQMRSYGGHLKEAVVGGTVELLLMPIEAELARSSDTETGLNLLDI